MEPQKQTPFGEPRMQVCRNKCVARETQSGAWGRQIRRNWVGCAVGIVCISSILANLVQLIVSTGLQRELKQQRHDIDNLIVTVSRHGALLNNGAEQLQSYLPSQEDTVTAFSQHDIRRRNIHNRIRPRPVTQLQGAGGDYDDIRRGAFLLWKRPGPSTYRHSFSYEMTPDAAKVKAIKIKTAGIYFIYFQVAFNGRTTMTDISECGSEVIRQPWDGSGSVTLLKSIITQDNEGGPYFRGNVNGPMYPLDTKPTIGVFHLYRDDKLLVQISSYCRAFAQISMDENYTHLGAFLVNELR